VYQPSQALEIDLDKSSKLAVSCGQLIFVAFEVDWLGYQRLDFYLRDFDLSRFLAGPNTAHQV